MIDQPKKGTVILMADDDDDDCLLVKESLRGNPWVDRLNFVKDGRELLEYLNDCRDPSNTPYPDLILLDLNMPRQDGREALREIKADTRFRSTPIVIFTTSNAERDIKLCYALGANAYFIKPMSFEGLVELLECLTRFWFHFSQLPSS